MNHKKNKDVNLDDEEYDEWELEESKKKEEKKRRILKKSKKEFD